MWEGKGNEKGHPSWNRLLLNHSRKLRRPRWLKHGPDEGWSTAWSMPPGFVGPASRVLFPIVASTTEREPAHESTFR